MIDFNVDEVDALSLIPPIELNKRLVVGKHANKLLRDALVEDPAYFVRLIDNGFRNMTDEVWFGMELIGTLEFLGMEG